MVYNNLVLKSLSYCKKKKKTNINVIFAQTPNNPRLFNDSLGISKISINFCMCFRKLNIMSLCLCPFYKYEEQPGAHPHIVRFPLNLLKY